MKPFPYRVKCRPSFFAKIAQICIPLQNSGSWLDTHLTLTASQTGHWDLFVLSPEIQDEETLNFMTFPFRVGVSWVLSLAKRRRTYILKVLFKFYYSVFFFMPLNKNGGRMGRNALVPRINSIRNVQLTLSLTGMKWRSSCPVGVRYVM